MNTSLRDLGERAGTVPVPQLDVAALVAAGESRIHRRRLAAVAAVTVAVLAVLSGAALLRPWSREAAPPPAGHDRTHAPDDGDTVETRQAARLLTYSVGTVIHWGDRTIDVGAQLGRKPGRLVHLDYLDATDDGVVFIQGPRGDAASRSIGYGASAVWFTDGSTPVRIGTTYGSAVRGFTIATSDSGSTIAWKEPGDEGSETLAAPYGPVVVYDTARMREVARFGGADAVPLEPVYDGVVYWLPDGRSCDLTNYQPGLVLGCPSNVQATRFDTATGVHTQVSWADYQADRRSRPGLLTGPDQRPRGCISCVISPDGLYRALSFVRRGGRLVLGGDYGLDFRAVSPEDRFTPTVALTDRPVRLRLPRHYEDAERWLITQWLDPDHVVLLADGEPAGVTDVGKTIELLICDLSTGSCRIAAGPDQSDGGFTPSGPAGIRG